MLHKIINAIKLKTVIPALGILLASIFLLANIVLCLLLIFYEAPLSVGNVFAHIRCVNEHRYAKAIILNSEEHKKKEYISERVPPQDVTFLKGTARLDRPSNISDSDWDFLKTDYYKPLADYNRQITPLIDNNSNSSNQFNSDPNNYIIYKFDIQTREICDNVIWILYSAKRNYLGFNPLNKPTIASAFKPEAEMATTFMIGSLFGYIGFLGLRLYILGPKVLKGVLEAKQIGIAILNITSKEAILVILQRLSGLTFKIAVLFFPLILSIVMIGSAVIVETIHLVLSGYFLIAGVFVFLIPLPEWTHHFYVRYQNSFSAKVIPLIMQIIFYSTFAIRSIIAAVYIMKKPGIYETNLEMLVSFLKKIIGI